MAGLSTRFKKAGFLKPKYMLEAHGNTLFYHSLNSFKAYFKSESFLFIALDLNDSRSFIQEECLKLGIENYQTVILEQPTRGQAETVNLALSIANVSDDESILIFNIDTFRPGYQFPSEFDFKKSDGYLETFVGSGKNWSNIVPLSSNERTVKYTAEKREISEFCCTGLYYFSKSKYFKDAFLKFSKLDLEKVDAQEYYIAPMYNILIENGLTINYSVIPKEDVIFCGIPDEYKEFLNCSPK